jgi:hypothetical protein
LRADLGSALPLSAFTSRAPPPSVKLADEAASHQQLSLENIYGEKVTRKKLHLEKHKSHYTHQSPTTVTLDKLITSSSYCKTELSKESTVHAIPLHFNGSDKFELLTQGRANENELYFDTEPSASCAAG